MTFEELVADPTLRMWLVRRVLPCGATTVVAFDFEFDRLWPRGFTAMLLQRKAEGR